MPMSPLQNETPLTRGVSLKKSGGRGIRTPGSVTYNSFQDCRVKPLCHSSGDKSRRFFNWMGKKMKSSIAIRKFIWMRYFVVFLFFLFPCFSYAGLKAFLDYSTFLSPGSGAYVETHLYVVGSSVVFKKNEHDRFQGAVLVRMLFKQKDSIRLVQKFRLHSGEVDDTSKGRPDFVDQQRFALANGVYDFEIEIADDHSSVAPYRWHSTITVFYEMNKMAVSDIEFLESFSKSETKGSMSRNGYDLMPYVADFYPENLNHISFYCEIYNLVKVLGDSAKFIVLYSINSAETNRVVDEFRGFAKQTAAVINPVLASFDIENLPSGNYSLAIEVRDRNNRLLLVKNRSFHRKNNKIPISLLDLSAVKTVNTFAFRITSRDSLVDFVRSLRPIAESSEKSFIDGNVKAATTEVLQQFLFNFWKGRYERQPELEWRKYLTEVMKVNKSFGSLNTRGYETDRGRVYLQYGPPDNRIVRDNDVGVYPYEMWQYFKLKDQSNRRFIFYNPDFSSNNYILLHSDAIGEVSNTQWESILNMRTDGSPANSNYGSRTKQDFEDSK
jgi:GWxTD domain-containing protein